VTSNRSGKKTLQRAASLPCHFPLQESKPKKSQRGDISLRALRASPPYQESQKTSEGRKGTHPRGYTRSHPLPRAANKFCSPTSLPAPMNPDCGAPLKTLLFLHECCRRIPRRGWRYIDTCSLAARRRRIPMVPYDIEHDHCHRPPDLPQRVECLPVPLVSKRPIPGPRSYQNHSLGYFP
jgi:hypothetical protein